MKTIKLTAIVLVIAFAWVNIASADDIKVPQNRSRSCRWHLQKPCRCPGLYRQWMNSYHSRISWMDTSSFGLVRSLIKVPFTGSQEPVYSGSGFSCCRWIGRWITKISLKSVRIDSLQTREVEDISGRGVLFFYSIFDPPLSSKSFIKFTSY